MNKNRQILSSVLCALLFPIVGLKAQTQSKTYSEIYNVGSDAVLELNTSYADIEFETWNKDQVEIVATVTLEGATDEEAKAFFENDPIQIVGNSKQIEVGTTSGRSNGLWPMESNIDFRFEAPEMEQLFKDLEIPELPDVPEMPEMPELPPMPPMPPMPFEQFDYNAYLADGEKYLKRWTKKFQKNFDKEYQDKFEAWGQEMEKNFDEDYQKRFEAWGKEFEARAKERELERAERMEERAEAMAERAEERARAMEDRARALEAQREAAQDLRQEANERREEARKRNSSERGLFISRDDAEAPNIFYFSSDGKNKKYEVKKVIKIKMPKSTRLKMNVKHGEVKLAATTNDLNASLRYASLLAATIDGAATDIKVAYSPIVVQKWNLGQLSADYSDRVNLKEVENLELNATSSTIVIDRLNQKALVTNNLGALVIDSLSDSLTELDVTVKNGEFRCKLPNAAVSLYLSGTNSSMTVPESLQMNTTINGNTTLYKGFKNKSDSGKMITVNSKYSEVVLEN